VSMRLKRVILQRRASFEHFIEDDFFEYNITWAPTVAYGTLFMIGMVNMIPF